MAESGKRKNLPCNNLHKSGCSAGIYMPHEHFILVMNSRCGSITDYCGAQIEGPVPGMGLSNLYSSGPDYCFLAYEEETNHDRASEQRT